MTCRAPMGMHRVDKAAPGLPRGCPGQHDWNAKGRVNVIGALLTGVLLCVGGCCAWGVLLCVGLTEANVDAGIFNLWPEHDLIPGLPSKAVSVMDRTTFHRRGDTKP